MSSLDWRIHMFFQKLRKADKDQMRESRRVRFDAGYDWADKLLSVHGVDSESRVFEERYILQIISNYDHDDPYVEGVSERVQESRDARGAGQRYPGSHPRGARLISDNLAYLARQVGECADQVELLASFRKDKAGRHVCEATAEQLEMAKNSIEECEESLQDLMTEEKHDAKNHG